MIQYSKVTISFSKIGSTFIYFHPNYLVKETPYSAYVTIRKKIIQSHEAIQPLFTNMSDDKVNIFEKEMDSLKERNKDLETKIALLTIGLDEAEDKNKAL